MALTADTLASALRVGSTEAETAEMTRLLTYTFSAVERHLGGESAYDEVADVYPEIVDEAQIRLAAYLYDSPNASRGTAYAAAMRNSGAAAILLPFRIQRAGSTADATAAAQ